MPGGAVGAVIRHQVAAVVLVLVWVLAVENLGSGLLEDRARFLPGQAGYGLAQAGAVTNVLSATTAAVVLALYAAAGTFAAIVTLGRRPVSLPT